MPPTRSLVGREVGPLSYGAANIGNLYAALSDDEAFDVLKTTWELGIRYFDTAPHYGLGLSERRLGAFLATKPRDEFLVSTKVGRLLVANPDGAGRLDDDNDFVVPATLKRAWDFSPGGIRRSLDESLERLGLDSVDIVYLHDPQLNDVDESPVQTGIASLVRLRDAGCVHAIGVGSMATDALLASVRTGALDLLMLAGRYTLADQEALAEVIPVCAAHGVGIVAAAVFNSGLLATNPGGSDPSGLRFDYRQVPDDVLNRVTRIAAICGDFGVELAAAALQFPLRNGGVRTVVAGAANADQLRQNAARMATAIPHELWMALAAEGLIA